MSSWRLFYARNRVVLALTRSVTTCQFICHTSPLVWFNIQRRNSSLAVGLNFSSLAPSTIHLDYTIVSVDLPFLLLQPKLTRATSEPTYISPAVLQLPSVTPPSRSRLEGTSTYNSVAT
ncbi:hypothetical protein HDK77DRAFT_132153 [Phyllosticta capitalensis]